MRCYKSSKQNEKEIAMKKRKSYAELEPVKKKKSVLRGFAIISLMLKTKRKTERLIFLYNMFSKKKKSKGRARLLMFCLVFGQLPELGKTFVPLRFTEHALLVTPRANMNESLPSTMQRKFIIVLIISNWT